MDPKYISQMNPNPINKTILLSGLCFVLFSTVLFSQVKYEREYRIKKEDVPLRARSFVDSCAFTSKIKWYKEESAAGISVEAKVKHRKRLYSIEFDTLGNIQDAELKIPWHSIPESTGKAIKQHLEHTFKSHRIIKTQLQWTGKRSTLIALIRNSDPSGDLTVKYEIVVSGKKDGKTGWYEFLFSEAGAVERVSTIVFRNTDNLDY